MLEIIHHERPPNFEDILKVFPGAASLKVNFAYGNKIYVPSGLELPDPLLKHELIHCVRQGKTEDTIIEWWEKYLKDIEFRYNEEILAHRAEYQACIELYQTRNARRANLKMIAQRLSSPLYGRVVTFEQAKREIKKNDAR